ncbi:alpha/beta fold hydrolase [Pectobacterium carotovorum]|uniref:alpha/beta fold hydrolase n=1 Tax=Pectobacterium carotovorum TaxID=554 RepID=UPI000ACFE09A|nr:alpha/beta fold hydrolase [Pectobacterium carotovorum]
MSKNFLLVHGAWQGAWVWNKIQPKLTAEGHTVKAIDLPGSGDDQTPATTVSLDAYARKIIDAASLLSAQGKVTLVGHSMGGAAITLAASLAPELFEKLIYVCAILPQNGESVAILGEQSRKGPLHSLSLIKAFWRWFLKKLRLRSSMITQKAMLIPFLHNLNRNPSSL